MEAFVSNVSTLEAGWIGASISSMHDARCMREGSERKSVRTYDIGGLWASHDVTDHCVVSYGKYRAHTRGTRVNMDTYRDVYECGDTRACVRACIRDRSALNQR